MESLERNGNAQLVTGANPTDAIASLEHSIPGDALACWNTDGPNLEDLIAPANARPQTVRPSALTTAPMVRLGQTVNPDPPSEFYGLHTDHLGTVRVVTDVSGNPVSFHNYFPFGEEISPRQFSYNTHQYTGHERDQSTGLDYMLARYYEAGLGRFLSVDPLAASTKREQPQSWNRYTYVQNRPLTLNDPTGEAEVVVNNPQEKQKFEQQLQDTAGPGITLNGNSIQFDDSQLGSGQKYSSDARDGLKEVASPKTPGTLVLDKNTGPDMKKAGEGKTAGPAPGGANGGNIMVVQVSGRDGPPLKGTNGTPAVSSPASMVLIHEILGHGLPGLHGVSGANAVNVENNIRRQLGMPERMPEPGH